MVGREVDENMPIMEARLPDGSRINVMLPPISLTGPLLTIWKYQQQRLTWDDLIGFGSVTPQVVEFLRACVIAKQNILLAGGTSSGKTTIMNALTEFIPDNERIATVEAAVELQVQHPHLLMFEARPANREGKGAISVADLIRSASRMRIDRIISSEASSDGAWEMVQAMNSGHDGSMLTIHAVNPTDALERLEMMVSMSGVGVPLLQVRQQMASAVNIIVQQLRLMDGKRRCIVNISEVLGVRNNVIETQPIFEFVSSEVVDGRIQGKLRPTGNRPKFLEKLEFFDIDLPDNLFEPDA
jgi:pilus assembly protein CpaF